MTITLYVDTPERVARWYDTLSPRQKRLLRRLEGTGGWLR